MSLVQKFTVVPASEAAPILAAECCLCAPDGSELAVGKKVQIPSRPTVASLCQALVDAGIATAAPSDGDEGTS